MTVTTGEITSAAVLHIVSRRAVARAAQQLWPSRQVDLGELCPSVTSYVCRLTVDGEELMAKYSWLGMSLVSVLRGAGGTWTEVRNAQPGYLRGTEVTTVREAQTLELLRGLDRPSVCETAGLHGGVLFTRKVPGTTLTDEMTTRPWDTGALLGAALADLRDLHGPTGAQVLRGAAPVNERSVIGIFRRKFNGRSSTGYLKALGQDSGLPEYVREELVDSVQHSVRRLLRMSDVLSTRRNYLIYGDLKPEHVFVDGPHRHFIDPAVQWAAGPEPDIAKLAGRSLLLATGHPDPDAGQQMVQGIASTLAHRMAELPSRERADRLREILVLWLMDTVSILSTCLSAPYGLPLAPHQQTLVAQSLTVARIADRVSASLTGSMAAQRLLDVVLSEVEHTAGSTR